MTFLPGTTPSLLGDQSSQASSRTEQAVSPGHSTKVMRPGVLGTSRRPHHIREASVGSMADFSSEAVEARGSRKDLFEVRRET